MEYIGGDELSVHGSGDGVNIGDGANVVVGGDIIGGDKISVGHISGNGAVAIGRGASVIDARGTQGMIVGARGPVVQRFGTVIIKDE
jgi:hypothetical protein